MIPARTILLLLLGVIGFSAIAPLACADSFGFYNTGSFQFNSNTISGSAEGLCEGQCVPWGNIVILDVSFNAAIINYEQSVSCPNDQCETEISGSFGPGSVTAELAVYDDSSQTFYLSSNSLQGSFSSHFCTGHCGSYRGESELSLNFDGLWNNSWYSTSSIQMECFHEGGCSDGTGAGTLTTVTPEPSVGSLLLGGMSCLWMARRRNCFQAIASLAANCSVVRE